MRLLELFCGTKSVSKAIGNQFTEVISVDMNEKANPTIVSDILKWDYKIYPPGYFHTIWASPPCTEYSCLNYSNPDKIPNLELADNIVKKTIEILIYYNPERFFIENPQTGTLKNREFMLGIPFVDIDYCRYGYNYRKRTRFWTLENKMNVLCQGSGKCNGMIEKRHKRSVGNSTFYKTVSSLNERYSIPSECIKYLFE